MSFLFLLVLLGAANTAYLHWQYTQRIKTGRKMFCLFGSHCEDVVISRYGKTLGVKNEVYGLLYYAGMVASVFLLSLFPSSVPAVGLFMMLSTLAAAGFSLYLLILQAFVLRKFCSWCLLAIAINVAILATLLASGV